MLARNSLISKKSHLVRMFSSLEPPRVLRIGDVLRGKRVYTSDDVLEYSKVSHDSNPLHFDSESARSAGFDDRLVHGMLVASLYPWIISSHYPGAVYLSQSLHFRSPVYIGDEILGEVEAVNIKEIKKKYIVKFSTKCVKNNGSKLIVLDGEAVTILPTLAMQKVLLLQMMEHSNGEVCNVSRNKG